METIKRNRSLTEFNNCLGDEVSKALDQCQLPEKVDFYDFNNGICLAVAPDESEAVFIFAPRQKDQTMDIVRIQKSEYVTDIQIAVSQFLTQYKTQNPYGLSPRNRMPADSFLKGIASYMAVVANSDEEISKTLELCKKQCDKNVVLESVQGNPFSYEFNNGFVNIGGSARGNFF